MRTFLTLALVALVSAQEYIHEGENSLAETSRSVMTRKQRWTRRKIIRRASCPVYRCMMRPSWIMTYPKTKGKNGCSLYPCGKRVGTKKPKIKVHCPQYMCRRVGNAIHMKMVCKSHAKTGKKSCHGVRVPPAYTCKYVMPKRTKNKFGCWSSPCGKRVCKKYKPKTIKPRNCPQARCMRSPLCSYSRGPAKKNGCPKFICGVSKCQKPPRTVCMRPRCVAPPRGCTRHYPKRNNKDSRGCPKYLCGIMRCTGLVKPKPTKVKCPMAKCAAVPKHCVRTKGPMRSNGCPVKICGVMRCTGLVLPKPTKVKCPMAMCSSSPGYAAGQRAKGCKHGRGTKNRRGCYRPCGVWVCPKKKVKCPMAKCAAIPKHCVRTKGPMRNGCPVKICGVMRCTGLVKPMPTQVNKVMTPTHANAYLKKQGIANVSMESTVTVVKKH